ncbi:hypothetical protein [Edaphocola flava]|uniref:hypothetical protein n=1 Tax=Edaphocola flava TaxID=2499629 RepID=UPI00100A7B6A|nr:hypothetical protein [Edaphocola flava]
MKKGLIILGALMMFSMAQVTDVAAQGRGHGNGHGNQGKGRGHDNDRDGYRGNDRGRQDKHVYKQSRKTVVYRDKGYRRGGPPAWAPAHGYRMKQHVYFPDYYAFYDPYRNGYVYWNNSAWIFSAVPPPYMSGVNLNRARVQIVSDIPLTTRPERYWRRYYNSYPPNGSVNININLPIR